MYNRSIKKTGLYDPQNEHDACGIGAVVDISGKKAHRIVEMGNEILINLQHRGAAGSDGVTGDGAGILFQIPHEFFADEAQANGAELPEVGKYGVAMVFLPKDKQLSKHCIELFGKAVAKYGMRIIFERAVRGNRDCLGKLALEAEPDIRQYFIVGKNEQNEELFGDAFERKLFMARKAAEKLIAEKLGGKAFDFYVTSMSCRTVCYKGMFLAHQLFGYYTELNDERMTSCLAVVHQRYSTNTFPDWRLAQPFRLAAHNGEINTLRGNINRMRARESRMSSKLLGSDLSDLFPVLDANASDSACFDNALELLVRSGRSVPHAMMMMVPEAFGERYHISTDKRAFYEYHAAVMEPWDGPAAMVFTDGRLVGGVLDRNGLRPCRYVVTNDDLAVLASEVGVIDFPPERIRTKGRLQPGKMFLIDTEEGRIVLDNEIKSKVVRNKPYRRWLEQNRIDLRGLCHVTRLRHPVPHNIDRRLRLFGYTREELQMLIVPKVINAQEPIGSMGTDTPLAVLSDRSKLLFEYFKQLFAQVTNPPIDPLREGLVMSLMSFVGKQRNLLEESPKHCCQLKLPHPILTDDDVDRLCSMSREDFKVARIPALFEVNEDDPAGSLERGMQKLFDAAERAIDGGASLLIITDRNSSADWAPIPALLATSGLHQELLRRNLRGEVGLIVESGEPREVMHFCLLCGFGANAVNPYLVYEAANKLQQQGDIPHELEPEQIIENYITAIKKGILKTISKMGISTLRSYHGAQLFQAIGLSDEVIGKYFTGTQSKIGGVGLDVIAREALQRHRNAYSKREPGSVSLDFGGEYHFRCDGEKHLWNPQTIAYLQRAVRNYDVDSYRKYAEAVNNQAKELYTLRGLFEFAEDGTNDNGKQYQALALSEVEPASEIVKRFYTGAMSHGSISKEAHETMALAMNRLGGMSNTGEGGEDPRRYKRLPGGDSLNSAIKQVASGRFGVTINYLAHARVIQIKMAQGAKPGEGGQLPGHKVTEEIAQLRNSMPGVTLISPPPHHDIYSIEDLAELIYDLKCANPGVDVSVKLVSEVGVGTVAAGVAKGNADEVLISGFDGGTGASPLSSIRHAGGPWEIGLAETQQTLVLNGLRDRIRVQVDGQIKTGRDVVIGALMGAECFGFGTTALVCLGCVLLRKCHQGNCSMGIATQNPELRKRFAGKAEYLQNYMMFVANEVREIMAKLGFRKFDDMVGHIERLNCRKAIEHWKARGIDFSALFTKVDTKAHKGALHCVRKQADMHKDHKDWQILKRVGEAISKGEKVSLEMPIRNTDRAVGTIISNKVVKQHGERGLSDGTIELTFRGTAGQSFGAFLAGGITLKLIGDANDYLGKGLSGGRIVVQTPPEANIEPHENIIAGNTLLYGATRGEVYVNGLAGERFAVRNSGAEAVVEGLGDHGCEYMTGGCVVVLGQTGRNFAAGMSGGIAYVLDEYQLFDTLCNLDMVDLENVWQKEDQKRLYNMIEQHYKWTESKRARYILDNWKNMMGRFVKVMPIEYRKSLQRLQEQEQQEADFTAATEEVFMPEGI